MLSRLACCLLVSLAGLCSSCASEEPIDRRGAAELWQRLQAEAYTSWDRAPGYDVPRPSVSAHGQTAEIFVDPIAANALTDGATTWPVGSTVVKNAYRGGELRLIAAMEKRDRGWFFAEWNASGGVEYAGSPSVCIDCHGTGDDAVRSIPLR